MQLYLCMIKLMEDKKMNCENDTENLIKGIGLEEYKKELELMRKQYGQEEELYPYIYMILREVGMTQEYSVRSVAGAENAESVNGRELFMGYAAFPDIVILDNMFLDLDQKEYEPNKEIDKMYCCVEAKGLTKMLLDIEGEIEIKYGNAICIKPTINAHYRYYKMLPDGIKTKIFQDDQKNPNICLKQITWEDFQKDWMYVYGDDVKNERQLSEVLEATEHCLDFCENRAIAKIGNRYVELYDANGKAHNYGELLGELLWYGNLIYTNGYIWKYLKIKKFKGRGNSLSNLRKKLYKTCVKDNKNYQWCKEIAERQIKFEVECEELINIEENKTEKDWIKFKNKLKEISKEWKNEK